MTSKNPMVREDLVEALSQSPMLQFLGKGAAHSPELRNMLTSSEVQQFPADHVIMTEGDESDRMYVLVSGTVAVSVGKKEICTMSDPGEIFGEFGAITGELRSATVKTVDMVTCLAVAPLFTTRVSLDTNGLFSQLVQRALTKILLGRLRQTSGELAVVQEALEKSERQVAFLRMDNDTLTNELERVKKSLREGLRGTRSGGVDEGL